jgi:hypothetical protein
MERFLPTKSAIAITGAGVLAAVATYYYVKKQNPKIYFDKDFENDNLVSYSSEAEARARQISDVSYQLLIRLG